MKNGGGIDASVEQIREGMDNHVQQMEEEVGNGSRNDSCAKRSCGKLMRSLKSSECFQLGVVCVVIAVVWILFSLPTIFYHIPEEVYLCHMREYLVVCMWVRLCVCMCASACVCACMCVCMCMYVYAYVYAYVCVYVCVCVCV